jgi:hypothetical protein
MYCKELIRNFILLAYADIYNKRQYDIVGTKDDQHFLLIQSYNFESESYEQVFEYKFEDKIFSVTPGNFERNGKTSLVITFRKAKKYHMKFMEFSLNKNVLSADISELGTSDTVPMAVTDYLTLSPTLVFSSDKDISLFRYNLSSKVMTRKKLIKLGKNEDLDIDHPYSFVDLDGDLRAELILVTRIGGKRYIKVYKMGPNEYYEIFSIEVSSGEIGPILFGDFNNSGVNSMVFISKEKDDLFYLNIYLNNLKRYEPKYYKKNTLSADIQNPESVLFSNTPKYFKQTPFNRFKQDYNPVLKIDLQDKEKEGSIPGGIFTTDIDLDGYLELFITVRKPDNKLVILPLRFDPNSEEFVYFSKAKDLLNIENVISFSTIDYNNRGKENIIINRISDTKLVLESYYNPLNDSNMKLSLTTTLLDKIHASYGMGLPGASYLLITNHGSSLGITNNFGPGPFLHLVSQTTTIGLGDSTYMIDCLKIGVPAIDANYKTLYVIQTNIIQNFDLIIFIDKNGKYKIEAFFKIVKYAQRIIYVLITVIIANIIVVLILYWKENQKLKLARTKDSMHPLFRSL